MARESKTKVHARNVRLAATRDKRKHNEEMRLFYRTHPAHRERVIERAARKRAECQAIRWDYKRTHPCVDCSEDDPIVLDFDHRDPKEKITDVSKIRVPEKLILEIAKCEIRCANCHRRRTHLQKLAEEI